MPPPPPDFRRLFFHVFSHGVSAYQLVGSWEKMTPTAEGVNMGGARRTRFPPDWQKAGAYGEEFIRTRRVFLEMAETEPVRAQVAGLFSYRSILSHIPARQYINPTLALIPVLQEHQYSLDWHSDMSPLEDWTATRLCWTPTRKCSSVASSSGWRFTSRKAVAWRCCRAPVGTRSKMAARTTRC